MTVSLQQRRRRRIKHNLKRAAAVFVLIVFITGISVTIFLLIERHKSPRPDEIQEKIVVLDWIEPALLPINDYSRPGIALKEVNAIVIHYVGNPGTTAEQNRSYYANLADNQGTYASSNFLVGLDGEIIECVPVNEVAYCSNWRNDDTLSIECCHPDETGRFTGDTYDALVRLTAWLCSEFSLEASDVIRHYDVTGKECPKYFVDHEDAWLLFKTEVQTEQERLQASNDAA